MRKLLSGLAVVALVAGAAEAKPGGGHGNGNGSHGGGNPHAMAQGGGGGGDNDHGKGQGQDRKEARGPAMNPGNRHAERGLKPQAKNPGQVQHRVEPVDRQAGSNPQRHPERTSERQASRPGRPTERQVRRDRRGAEPASGQRGEFARAVDKSGGAPRFAGRRRSPIDGCPPGLAKKYNGCMPPGLAREQAGANRNLAAAAGAALLARNLSPSWFGFDDYGPDYRYADGYLLRTGDDRVLSYVPLLGGALAPGEPWLPAFQPAPIPAYWTDYYDLGPADRFRYYGDAIYEVDPRASKIERIVALLVDDPWAVGQPMPYGYDVYNVPYSYRSRYVDGTDHWYRYADGYVYDVDPATRLVVAIMQLLT